MSKQQPAKNGKQEYISYIDLLGVGDASAEVGSSYQQQLHDFKLALCEAVDVNLNDSDKVFAFSDCAFASSDNLQRMGSFLSHVQSRMWAKDIYLKGGLAVGESEHYPFAQIKGQSKELTIERQKKLQGEFFHKGFVKPALIEKNLKGIGIQVDNSVTDANWLQENTVITGCLPNETVMRIAPFRDLAIQGDSLSMLSDILKTSMRVNHQSRRVGRYYVPLIINWVKGHDYSSIDNKYVYSALEPKDLKGADPFAQLVLSPKVTSEVSSWAGGDAIFYALLSSVYRDCSEPTVDKLAEFIAANKKLCDSATTIPNEICSDKLQKQVVDASVRLTFNQLKAAP